MFLFLPDRLQALEKYAKYVTTSSSIPEEDVPSSLGFKF
jgi:hypothetical protein